MAAGPPASQPTSRQVDTGDTVVLNMLFKLFKTTNAYFQGGTHVKDAYYETLGHRTEGRIVGAIRHISEFAEHKDSYVHLIAAVEELCKSIALLEETVNATFEAGYELGFEEGRCDGYHDGFAKGQESNVKPDDAVTDWMLDPEGR